MMRVFGMFQLSEVPALKEEKKRMLLITSRQEISLACTVSFPLNSTAQEFKAKGYSGEALDMHERLRRGLELPQPDQDVHVFSRRSCPLSRLKINTGLFVKGVWFLSCFVSFDFLGEKNHIHFYLLPYP
ncbi:MAG: hypothetical protein ACRC4N_16990 [Gammaproteobacteria bacterium]